MWKGHQFQCMYVPCGSSGKYAFIWNTLTYFHITELSFIIKIFFVKWVLTSFLRNHVLLSKKYVTGNFICKTRSLLTAFQIQLVLEIIRTKSIFRQNLFWYFADLCRNLNWWIFFQSIAWGCIRIKTLDILNKYCGLIFHFSFRFFFQLE